MMIVHASFSDVFSFRRLGDLYELTGATKMKFISGAIFSHYLLQRGLISESDFDENGPPDAKFLKPYSSYENPLKKGTVWDLIYHDDINQFVKLVTVNNIDLQNERMWVNNHRFFIISFACYCKSINIVKFLLINNVQIDVYGVHNAIASGSEEIIHLLQERNINFNNMLRTAISSHQNTLAKWLYENYKDIFFVFPDCVQMFNTEMMLFFVEECGWDINEKGILTKTALHIASENNDFIIIKYLLSKKADKEIKDENGKTPADYAQTTEIKSIFALSS